MNKNELSVEQEQELLKILEGRFKKNMNRHEDMSWVSIKDKLATNADKLWSLYEMERTGGEPDVIDYDEVNEEYIFCDCSQETPKGRRSICYDKEAQEARKEFKPENNAIDMAKSMGIDILTEQEYRRLQQLGNFDTKTSSWIKTPVEIRKLGGALFADFRYGHVFVYHNGANSYYAVRGFRGKLRV